VLDTPLNVEGFFFEYFSASSLAMSSKDGLGKCVDAVIKTFIAENTVYLELRSSPKVGTDYDVVGYYTTIIEKCKEYEGKFPVRLIISLNRGIPDLHFYDDLLTQIQKVPDWQKYIVGLDLSGDPYVKEFSDFVPLINGAKAIGLKITLHTSEVEPHFKEVPEVFAVRPNRIGHFNYFTEKELI
jgi:adenosine deaminase